MLKTVMLVLFTATTSAALVIAAHLEAGKPHYDKFPAWVERGNR